MTTPQPFNLDVACAAAAERLRRSLNRSVAQHRMHLERLAAQLRQRRVG